MSRFFTAAALAVLFSVQPAFAASGEKSAASEWLSNVSQPVCKGDPSWRFSASESCEHQAVRIAESQRKCFLSACLGKMSSAEQVRQKTEQKRRATCEQNAKNKQLGGAQRDGYIRDCLNRNEAAQAAGVASGERKVAASGAAGKGRADKHAERCAAQADGAKGKERKKTVAECRKNASSKSGGRG